jgi:hypothetical protein
VGAAGSAGRVAPRGRGVDRFDEVPATGHGQFMEAVLAVGPGANLTLDSVLLLNNVGLVNPRKNSACAKSRTLSSVEVGIVYP